MPWEEEHQVKPSLPASASAYRVHSAHAAPRGARCHCGVGEGTYSQLRRRFGPAQADEYIKKLGVIWISHIHADHHVGLPTLLAARTRLLGPDCEPLLVLGPRPLRRALQASKHRRRRAGG